MNRIAGVLVLCLWLLVAAAQPLQPVQILLHQFTPSPSVPEGGLLQVPDGSFYGVTSDTILSPGDQRAGDDCRPVRRTPSERRACWSPERADCSTARRSGAGGGGQGTVFRFDPASGALSTLHAFSSVSMRARRRSAGSPSLVGSSMA